MKKFYAIALGALVLMASCSKDDPEPTLPDLVVTEVSIVPTASQIQAPAITNVQTDVYDKIVTFANGQVIRFTPSATVANAMLITHLSGTAADVIVPPSLTIEETNEKGEKEMVTYTVAGWDLSSHEGVSNDIKTITIPKTAGYSMQGNSTEGINLKLFNNEFFTDLSDQGENLTGVYLEDGFANYISDNGVIYRQTTSDVILAMVPRQVNADSREFTVPNDVTVIGAKAFNKCRQIERVIISKNVKKIEDQAFLNLDNLIAVDIIATEAPLAAEHAFGHYARKATLRIPVGSRASYLEKNPFIANEPNAVHPVPENAYINYMGHDRNFFSANNTANWTEEDWTNNVPQPKAPEGNLSSDDELRYHNALAAYRKYQGALSQYNTDRANWEAVAAEWKQDKAKELIKKAEPIYPGTNMVRPTRPSRPSAEASKEELDAYNEALAVFFEANEEWSEEQGRIAQFEADLPYWKTAKEGWESTRGYEFFKKIEEVEFTIR